MGKEDVLRVGRDVGDQALDKFAFSKPLTDEEGRSMKGPTDECRCWRASRRLGTYTEFVKKKRVSSQERW